MTPIRSPVFSYRSFYRPTHLSRTAALLVIGTLGVAGLAVMASETDPSVDEQVNDEVGDPRAAPPYLLNEADPVEEPDSLDELETTVDVADWERLADCESGRWTKDGDPEPDSARWDYGLDFDHDDNFQGGLNFHPATWDAYRDPDMPEHAGRATPVEEIQVAERVLEEQGWDAWPVCSEKMDLTV